LNQNQTSSSGSGSVLTLNQTCGSVSGSENVENMLYFYHIRQEFRFKPGLKRDQTSSSGSGSALILNQTSGSVSGSATKVSNQTKLDFGNTTPPTASWFSFTTCCDLVMQELEFKLSGLFMALAEIYWQRSKQQNAMGLGVLKMHS
jgi:hypothetical protein